MLVPDNFTLEEMFMQGNSSFVILFSVGFTLSFSGGATEIKIAEKEMAGDSSCESEAGENAFEVRNLIPYVDEYIGIDKGKCSFGVSLPFGSIRPCPHTYGSRSGYDANKEINGFTLINTGSVYKYGNLLISPQVGLDCWDDNRKPCQGQYPIVL